MLSESRDAGHSGDIAKKLTVKLWGKGVYAKNDKGSAATQYFTRHAGQFIYSKLDFLNSAFGVVPQELESYESTADLPAFDCIGVDPFFMFYRAIQPSFYLTNGMIADGSRKAKRIHVETFLDMPLDLPSIEEQKKVASYFTQLDNLITLHQREYFSLRFGSRSAKIAQNTLSWEQRKFSDFTFLAGERNKDDLDLEPFAITNNQGFIAQSEAHDDFGYMKDVDRKMYIVVKPNSFAYNPARINVGSLGYYEGEENVIVSSLYEVFQTAEYVDDKFLKHWFKTKAFQDWI